MRYVLEVPQIGHGRRVGRVSQRWLVQAVRMSRRRMMMALASAMKASITRVRRSVQYASFLKAAVMPGVGPFDDPAGAGLQRGAFGADHRVASEFVEEVTGLRAVIAGVEVDGDVLG